MDRTDLAQDKGPLKSCYEHGSEVDAHLACSAEILIPRNLGPSLA